MATPTFSPLMGLDDGEDDYVSLYKKLMQKDSPALELYKQHISNMPKYEDYRPGFVKKLYSGLAAAAEGMQGGLSRGLELGENIRNQDYIQALRTHAGKGKGLEELANIEQKNSEMERKGRMDIFSILDKEKDNKRFDKQLEATLGAHKETERHNKALEEDRAEDNERDLEYKGTLADIALKNARNRERQTNAYIARTKSMGDRGRKDSWLAGSGENYRRALTQAAITNPAFVGLLAIDPNSKRALDIDPAKAAANPALAAQLLKKAKELHTLMSASTHANPNLYPTPDMEDEWEEIQ